MSMSELMAKQLQLQRVVDRALDNFKKLGRNNLTAAKVRARIGSLKESWLLMINGHAALLRATTEATRSSMDYFKDNALDTSEENYLLALDHMSESLEELEPPVSPNTTFNSSQLRASSSFSVSHLPSIQLPPFDGNYSDWEEFRDRFTTLIIKNKELNDFARMHFLTSCVKGRAHACIANLTVTADNFSVAWQALTTRFESKRRLLNYHLSSLLDLNALSRESASELQSLSDRVNVTVTALNNLQRTSDQLWDDILVHIIVHKLDPVTRKAWNHKCSESREPRSYRDLCEFLTNRTSALEDYANSSSAKPSAKGSAVKISNATASPFSPTNCPLCKSPHYFSACPEFVRATPSQRRDFTKQHKRCFNCLSHKHSSKDCKSKYSCRSCHQKHHTMLHVRSNQSLTQTSNADSESPVITSPESPTASHSPQAVEYQPSINALNSYRKYPAYSQVLLATAWITVSVSSGRVVVVRALLDQGSEMTFISTKIAQLLRVNRFHLPVKVSGIGGFSAGTFSQATHITISPGDSFAPSITTTAIIMQNLTSYVPKSVADISKFSHLSGLQLADFNPASAEPIDVLIGADIYNDVILDGVRKGDVGHPLGQNSIFGWIISGPIRPTSPDYRESSSSSVVTKSSSTVAVHNSVTFTSLENEIKKFWEVEELPRKVTFNEEDERCENHFRTTHSRTTAGRYIVRLPFKLDSPIHLGETRSRAENMLKSLLRRLQSHPTQAAEYAEFLSEYERLGHMRKAPNSSDQLDQVVYIPHHPVFRESSTTSHLRVVFNASCGSSNGSSLNDHLMAGPKLQTDLLAVILRWRHFKYVCTADIAKMYRQVLLDTRDVNYQRILWNKALTDPPIEYQLLTLTYGMACAPFLALRVIQQLASDDGSRFPLAAPILRDNIYVDDVLFGADSITIVRQKRDQLVALLRSGGFELRKWASNSKSLLSDIDPANHGLALKKTLAVDDKLRILGIEWNPSFDAFQITISLPAIAPMSKRSILAAIAKLFDPLGWVTPAIITAKIFMQRLWKENLGWDDNIPATLLSRWSLIYSHLSHLNGLQVTRWTGLEARVAHAELHGFADASNLAYSAVVYLKVISRTGEVTVTLIAGKSKVAPLTPLSVPRLELSAAVLLAKLLKLVQNSLPKTSEAITTFCWTDSTIVLAWVKQHPSRWKTFVANRVADVQSRLPNGKWKHVPTGDNPADCASRGLLGSELRDHGLWWHGPAWLKHPCEEWPQADLGLPIHAPLEEKSVALQASHPQDNFDLASRFATWPKLIRVTAYVLRFVSLCRRARGELQSIESPGSALAAVEVCAAKTFWIKRMQTELFPREIVTLSKNQSLSVKSPISQLRPFLDHDGVLRVGGRIGKAPVPFATRHPILLASHPLVHLLVEQAHLRMLHAGIQLTMSVLRKEFWIIRARSMIRAVINRCVACTRERAATPSQLMGDLPSIRVSAPARSFLHCGLDYAGPVQVRPSAGRGIKSRKAYIALFICLATRAVHLELVDDYSSSAFLNAFSRFCARRGLPQSIYSDNGTNFVGADRELALAHRAAIQDPNFQNRTATDNVSWHFIPPSAPHFGGIWEAGVKSVKHHLHRVLGTHTLTYDEFTTLLCRVEACLNSRPLAPLSDAFDNYDTLTPGHFLIGSAITVNPEQSLLDVNENRLTRWQLIRQLTESFWKRWYDDYVNTLQQRSKWRSGQPAIKPGQLVLLRNSLLPPCKWEMGRVMNCHPGSDGLTRVVTVRTSNSEYKRPICKLCVLPIDCEKSRT